MKIKLTLLVVVLMLANCAMAYTITGTVTGNGDPLPGAVITRIAINGISESDAAYAVTDIDGKYSIESGTGNQIMITASFASFMSQYKWAEGSVVNFDLKETPSVPVTFFSSLLDQSEILDYVFSQQIKSLGIPGFGEFKMYLSDNSLVFSINTTKDNLSGFNINNYSETTLKGYLQQLKAEGGLNEFLTQMKDSGMKWGFGVYNTSTGQWMQYKAYTADQIRKLL